MKSFLIPVTVIDNGVYIKFCELSKSAKGGDTVEITIYLYRLLINNRYTLSELADLADKTKSAILAGIVATIRIRRSERLLNEVIK